MRPLRLDMHGFTVFRDPTVVDLTDVDFFVLVGPTGSGKSTVLDAICFALYGTVPRWADRRAIANALAPSVTEARVRLVFEASGARYAVTRVVRRDAKGRAATTHAGMELLPAGVDLSTWDASGELGEPLAGTPSELDAAVLEVIGLPYEQFTSCVLLPQGAFAEFLHAKPAVRQQILVNLLGLSVYEKIREQATAKATEHAARQAAADGLLAELDGVSDEALNAAIRAHENIGELLRSVDGRVAELAATAARARAAREEFDACERDLATLARLLGGQRTLEAAREVGEAVGAATAAATAADAAQRAAEDDEEKLHASVRAAGDEAQLRGLLRAHDDLDRLIADGTRLADELTATQASHAAALEQLGRAQDAAEARAADLDAADAELETARAADLAAALRPRLREGHECPVCTQTVTTLPAPAPSDLLERAQARRESAREAASAAERVVAAADRAARDREHAVAAIGGRRDELHTRTEGLRAQLAAAPDRQALSTQLAELTHAQRALAEATNRVRAAREVARQASAAREQAQERARRAWRTFDDARDALAHLGPPPADRDDFPNAWQILMDWARTQRGERVAQQQTHADERDAALAATADITASLAARFREAGVTPPGTAGTAGTTGSPGSPGSPEDPAEYQRVVAVAQERARADIARITARREQADKLRAQRAEHEREAQIARALAGHLRANNFERWLLAEALDRLVEGASEILRDLSAGQYELTHDRGEFYVTDHHDAGLQRAVRTLSGGETFQASLALALSLSQQLAGMAGAAASLESILLDEGFGTLDNSTLDVVAATLENLAARGDRMVGVVTHVAALAHRIPVQFEVSKQARSTTITRVDA